LKISNEIFKKDFYYKNTKTHKEQREKGSLCSFVSLYKILIFVDPIRIRKKDSSGVLP